MRDDAEAGRRAPDEASDLIARWETLVSRYSTSVRVRSIGDALIGAWCQPHRQYHNITHLRDVLLRVDELAAHSVDPDAVRLAAWYHDVVYAARSDDEENSARRAQSDLAVLGFSPAMIHEVVRLVRLTASHNPHPGDRNGETLSDADLAILAAPPDRYARYAASVRAEYSHVAEDEFRIGRSRVLVGLLDAPTLYRTQFAIQHWTVQAHGNLRAELDRLADPTSAL